MNAFLEDVMNRVVQATQSIKRWILQTCSFFQKASSLQPSPSQETSPLQSLPSNESLYKAFTENMDAALKVVAPRTRQNLAWIKTDVGHAMNTARFAPAPVEDPADKAYTAQLQEYVRKTLIHGLGAITYETSSDKGNNTCNNRFNINAAPWNAAEQAKADAKQAQDEADYRRAKGDPSSESYARRASSYANRAVSYERHFNT